MAIVDTYISLNSPWTFLGSERLIALRERHQADVRLKPAKFTEVFAATGGLPLPQRPPARQAYRLMELERWRRHLGIPIVLRPRHFPADETQGARLVIAAGRLGLDALRFSSEIGRALWCRDENITEATTLDRAAERAGLDPAQLRAKAPAEADLDAEWQRNTEDAIARGVFGAPSYVLASGEIFWGQDRLDFLDRALAAGG